MNNFLKIETLFGATFLLLTIWVSKAWTTVSDHAPQRIETYDEKNKERHWIKINPDSLIYYLGSMPDFDYTKKSNQFTIELNEDYLLICQEAVQKNHSIFEDFFYFGESQRNYDSLCLKLMPKVIDEEKGGFETLSDGKYGFKSMRCQDAQYLYLPVNIVASIIKKVSESTSQNKTNDPKNN